MRCRKKKANFCATIEVVFFSFTVSNPVHNFACRLFPPFNSVEHIVGNLVMQLILGIPLELVHKGFEVGMVYLAGVLAGASCDWK